MIASCHLLLNLVEEINIDFDNLSQYQDYKHICLVTREGGYGDAILSSRNAYYLSRFFEISIICPDRLKRLFSVFPWFSNVICTSDILSSSCDTSEFGCWSLLPNEVDIHTYSYTSIDNIKPVNYKAIIASYISPLDLWSADTRYDFIKLFLHERNSLKANNNSLIVGLVWMSGVVCDNRFLDIELFSELALVPNIALVSLQKGHNQENIRANCTFSSHFVESQALIDKTTDFADDGLIASYCDHIITVDTSVAHLCGIIGCRTHILCANNAYEFWTPAYIQEMHNDNVSVYPFDHYSRADLKRAISSIINSIAP